MYDRSEIKEEQHVRQHISAHTTNPNPKQKQALVGTLTGRRPVNFVSYYFDVTDSAERQSH